MVNIIGYRKLNLTISGMLFVTSVFFLIVFGLNAGIDFKGGSMLEATFSNNRPQVSQVQAALKTLNFGEMVVQPSGEKNMTIKTRFLNEEEHQVMLNKLRQNFEINDNKVLEIQFQTIGPAISSQLRIRALYAAIAVMIGIIIFIAYSFRRVSKPIASWKYGVTAILAVFHDTVITTGVFSFLGHFAGVEVDIPFVVAILTILGYSVNDTIVIFDRIRENLVRHGSDDFAETVNVAVNQTFMRSINTTLNVLIVLAALFVFGGASIHYFSLALLIGIFLGAYSSIFIASPLLVVWHNWNNRHSDE